MLHPSAEKLSALPLIFSPGPTCDSRPPEEEDDEPAREEKIEPRKPPEKPAGEKGLTRQRKGTSKLERPAFIPIDSVRPKEPS